MITTVAPAKINLSLEILGRRDDGYHEIVSVMQTVDLHDELTFEPGGSGGILVTGTGLPPEEDLVYRAAQQSPMPDAAITVRKRIPAGAGLGGGSSDAAATLRGLARLAAETPARDDLASAAAALGSDVPFFLRGGTAIAEGRGERITPLPDAGTAWLVVVSPPIAIPRKTERMYSALDPRDFTDGARTRSLADRIRNGKPFDDGMLYNCFGRAVFEVFPSLAKYRDWMIEAGVPSVHVCGAGPSLFALVSGEAEARAVRARMNRPKMGELVFALRTITAEESTLTW
jgi:4-diphosphocytidyl-2-C-methyl-D-erythritol kinase